MTTLSASFESNEQIANASQPHQYIQFLGEPKKGSNTEAGFLVVDHYLNKKKNTRDQWRRETRLFNLTWSEPNGEKKISKPLNYRTIARYIRTKGQFDPVDFNLGPMECFWLDVSFPMKMDFHMSDETGALTLALGIPQQQFGANFPITPKLQREGHLYGSFQPQLTQRIIQLRKMLIDNSAQAMKDEWIFDLRSLISDSVSLVDITLNQTYIKAEFDPLPGWHFDKAKLGERHGRRMKDKLKWVYQITGKLPNIQGEEGSLHSLREIRNHLMHFDPPTVLITLEEATIWLNQIIDLGIILIKIRKALGVAVSAGLVNFILQKQAIFVPKNTLRARKPLGGKNEDYYSSTWPKG